MAESNYQVRDFRDVDVDSIMDLWELTGMGGLDRGDDLKVINMTLKMGGRFLVLFVDEKIVGSSWMTGWTTNVRASFFN